MNITATILDVVQTANEVTVTVVCSDGQAVNDKTTFSVGLTDATDSDITQVITSLLNSYTKEEQVLPVITTQVGQEFALNAATNTAQLTTASPSPMTGGVI